LIPPDQIDVVNWQRLAGSWGIRIFTKDGLLHRFAGFKEAVSAALTTSGLELNGLGPEPGEE
jgi:hypothetical protein